LLLLETLMRSNTGDLADWVAVALIIIALVFGGVVAAAFMVQPSAYPWLFPPAMVIVLIAGFTPRILYAQLRHQQEQSRLAEDRAFNERPLAALATRRQDIETRIAEHRPYTGPEALVFFNQVTSSNLTYRGLGDHSADALAMLKRALDGKILDPNVT